MSQKRSRVNDEEGDPVADAYLSTPAPPPPGGDDEGSLLEEGDLSLSEASPPPAPHRPGSERDSDSDDDSDAPQGPSPALDVVMYEASASDDDEDSESAGAPTKKKKTKKKKKKELTSTFWAHPIGLALDPLQPRVLIVFERDVPVNIAPGFGQQRYFAMPLTASSAGLWNVLCEYRFKRAHLRAWSLTAAFARALGTRRTPTPLKTLPVRGVHPYETALMEDVEVVAERVFATEPQRKMQEDVAKDTTALSVAIVKRAMASSLAPLAVTFPQWTERVPDTPLLRTLGLTGQRLVTFDRTLEVLAILHGHRLVNRLAGLHRRHVNSQRKTIYPKPAQPLKEKDRAFLHALAAALPQETKSDGFERSRPGTLLKKWTGSVIQKALRLASRHQTAGRLLLRAFSALDHSKEDLTFITLPAHEAHQLLHSVPVPLCPPGYHARFLLGGASCRFARLTTASHGADAAELSDEELVLLQTLLDQNATLDWVRRTPWPQLRVALRKAGGFLALVPPEPDHEYYITLLDRLLARALTASQGRYTKSTSRTAYHLSWRQLMYTIVTLVDSRLTTLDLQEAGLGRPLWHSGGPSLRMYALGFAERVLMHTFASRLPDDAAIAAQLLAFTPAGATGRYFVAHRLAPFETYRGHLQESGSSGFHPDLSLPALQIPLQPTAFFQQEMALRALRALAETHPYRVVMTAHALQARAALSSMRAHIREALFGQAWSVCVVHPTGPAAPFTHSAYERAFAPDALARDAARDAYDEDEDDMGLDDSSDDEADAPAVGRQRLCFAQSALRDIPAHQRKEVYVVNLEAFSSAELKQLARWLAGNPATERIVLHYRSGAYFQATGDPVGLARQVLDAASGGDLTSHLGSHASSAFVQTHWARALATRFDQTVARGRAKLLGASAGKPLTVPRTAKELSVDAVQEPWQHGLRPRRPHDDREAPLYWTTWAVLQQFSAAAWGMLYASELRLIVRDVPVEITPADFPEALDTLYRESNAGTNVPHPNQHPQVCARVFLLNEGVDGADLGRSFKA